MLGAHEPARVVLEDSEFKVVENCDRNFSPGKINTRKAQIEQGIQHDFDAMGAIDPIQQPISNAKVADDLATGAIRPTQEKGPTYTS